MLHGTSVDDELAPLEIVDVPAMFLLLPSLELSNRDIFSHLFCVGV